ncbi:hypothetical protein [Desertivirga arenae]|uniref:hypothetical protein n=1 Tax=Desertivirga arenae TaxID=2810309 RepID=UPI001A956476|nr:hypothetical protein [Pedobacter sp. SYSU D00823]
MLDQLSDKSVRTFVYELKNCAIEYGFKAESWIIKMATALDKKNMEKLFYPMLFIPVLPETSIEMLQLVSVRLKSESVNEHHDTAFETSSLNCRFLVAYHPDRKV